MEKLANFSIFKKSIALIGFIILQSCGHQSIEPENFDATIITDWNGIIMDMAIEEDGLLTLKGVRTAAMMHVAVHDALNAIEPIYSDYAFKGKNAHANPIATSAQTAYEIAIIQFPDTRQELVTELNKWLSRVKNDDAKREGINLGKIVASNMVKNRSEDLWDGTADYTWHPMAPGVYAEFNQHSGTPEGFIFGAGWAAAEPFMLTSQDQFRSPPPQEINSSDYTKAFKEVEDYGSLNSVVRTKDQAHMAMWWKDFVENSHNRLARELVTKEELNLWQAARVFAQLNMTVYDDYVSVFDNKFYYNHWRPYTAIRWAANDENPDTEPDPEWDNLHQHTYAFPSYPSAHGTASTAAMTVLASTQGTGDKYDFVMKTEEVDKAGPFSGKIKMDPPTRTFSSFLQAGLEASMSRVYLGIHFRYDSEEGHQLGAKIGQYALDNFLLPLKP